MWKYVFNTTAIIRRVKQQLPEIVKKTSTNTLMAFVATQTLNNNKDQKEKQCDVPADGPSLSFATDMKAVCLKNDEAMNNLMNTLNACVEEICEQYQHSVAKQIEITLVCMNLDPVGEHWDELTKYRVEAGDLKVEFEKYCMLIERMGEMINNQLLNASNSGNAESMNKVKAKYDKLLHLLKMKREENRYWDHKLLDINTQSILLGRSH